MFTSLFVCFYSLCFSQTKELQFRLVLTEQESKTISFDKYIDDFGKEIFVDKEILLSNKDIKKMGIVRSNQEFPGKSIVMIIFTDSGKSKFLEVTRKNINNQLAVIVDDKVLASPYIRESIYTGWTAIPITSFKEAEELIKNLGFVPYLHGDIKN